MTVETFDFTRASPKRIALIVRGKLGPDHHPGNLEQHADCVLATGAPVGFFGEGNDRSGNRVGLRMQGVVYDYSLLQRHRPYYVDRADAVANRVVSTVLLIEVDDRTASAFAAAWNDMTLNPGDFNIVGGNCATHASAAFLRARVLASEIPGLDTPDNLYGQLVAKIAAAKRRSITGYIGFEPRPGGYVMEWEPFALPSQPPAPGRPGSSSFGS